MGPQLIDIYFFEHYFSGAVTSGLKSYSILEYTTRLMVKI